MSEQAALIPMTNDVPVPTARQGSGEDLLRLAVEKGSDVATLERLMAMRRELRAEYAKSAYDQAMADFQRACPPIVKSEAVHQKNSSAVRYKYAPLDVIIAQTKDLIHSHGFSYKVDAKINGSQVLATCEVKHREGHSETASMEVPIDPDAYMNQQQKFASAFTFAKRYAFCSAFGIVTADADDDGRSASAGPGEKRPTPPPARPAPATPRPAAAPAASAPAAPHVPAVADAATRALLIRRLEDCSEIALEYFRKLTEPGVILPNEGLADLPLWIVPVDLDQYNALRERIGQFANGDPAVHPYPPNKVPEVPATPSKKPVEVPRDKQPATPESEEAWRDFELPFGAHQGERLGDVDKKYLYGLWRNFEVELEYKGKPRRQDKIEADTRMRQMLDLAGAHYHFDVKD